MTTSADTASDLARIIDQAAEHRAARIVHGVANEVGAMAAALFDASRHRAVNPEARRLARVRAEALRGVAELLRGQDRA